MKQGPKYRIITRIISQVADCHRRSAIQRAGVFLAVLWSSFGTVTVGFDSPPLRERIATLLLCGLIPAAAIYVAGYILSQLIMFRGQATDITVAGCLRYITLWVNYFVNRAAISAPKVWNNIVGLAENVCCSVNHLCWRTQARLVEIAYLLIRSTARLIIRLQDSEDFKQGSNELTESRRNHSVEHFAPPLAPIGTPAFGNSGIALRETRFSGDGDDLLNRPEQHDLFRLQQKLVAGTAMLAGLGVCACAYFLLPSSNKTVPQSAELSAAVQAVPASPVQTASNPSEFFAAVDRSEYLAEPLDGSQKVALAAVPTGSLRTAPARSGDILFVQRPRVNIRSTPSVNGSVVAIALKGTPFKVTSRQVDWVQVQNGRFRGWINAQFLAPAETR
jgi:Bacterial SH3 domain